MEFWGVEVKAGKPLKVTPEVGKLVHISQAALGEFKGKGGEIVPLRLKIDDQKLVLGALSTDKTPQVVFDLVFHKEFELSHDWKHGSVHFLGYVADCPFEYPFKLFQYHVYVSLILTINDSCLGFYPLDSLILLFSLPLQYEDDDEEDEERVPTLIPDVAKVEAAKPIATKAKTAAKPETSSKQKVSIVEPKKDSSDESDDDSDEDMEGDSDDSDDDEDDSDDEEETPTPKKPINDKKRANDSASKTPVQAKKAKADTTPQKKDGKKVAHVATPHPVKQAGKTQGKGQQSPKSDAKITCKSCTKTFTSDGALQSHARAKHDAK
ncbi:histone deacetylase HDT1-like [Impatiens glandulifera]|uniref:histone deacetylase HDT1-like n=1 Tax=Impatiens glandulifera TaxID=253017 RepID=UPI001FB06754|nr:histone deacetylase HDT1-like [Impatiens glandulifera]